MRPVSRVSRLGKSGFDLVKPAIQSVLMILPLMLAACSGGKDASSTKSASSAAEFAPAPDADTFYAAQADVPDTPGKILKSRSITYQPAGVPLPNQAWQLQYVTHDSHGHAIAAVTTVIKPIVPNIYGQPVLVSFQDAYDSLGAPCTPSHTATGSTDNSTNLVETLEFTPGLQALGWTLVIPDYEGPNGAFGAGPLSGQATLDSVRAALQFEPLGLSSETPIGLWGYSGGAYASTWASALAPQYAPELNLIGVVSGGTPVDLFNIVQQNENTDEFNFLFTSIIGITREYPELLPVNLLTPAGATAVNTLRNICSENEPVSGPALTGETVADYVAAANPYDTPGFLSVRPKVTLLQSTIHPTTNIYLFHEVNDQLVSIVKAQALVAQWCTMGVPLSFYQSTAATAAGYTPLGVHTAGAALGTPAAIAYLTGRFNSTPVTVTPPGTVSCN